jgi:SNF2 family DNA or RNA helicase
MSTTPPLRPYQEDGIAFAAPKPASMIAGGMGVGKSCIATHLIADKWEAKRTLIITPPSVRNVWRRELPKHCGDKVRPVILDQGTVAQRTEQAAAALTDPSPVAIVINLEASWREPFSTWALDQRWDCVTYDEAHGIKTEGTVCSDMAAALTKQTGQRLCLTGTPMAHSPLDAWGQYRFLDPKIFGASHTLFLQRYAAPAQMRKRKKFIASHNAVAAAIVACYGPDSPLLDTWGEPPDLTNFLPGLRNAAEFEEKIAPITWRCKTSDVLDLPPLITEERYIDLPPGAAAVYRQLEEEAFADVGEGVPINSYLTLMTRLQQVTSGFITDQAGRTHVVHTAKRQALHDLLAETGEPTIVFCRYTADLDTVEQVAKALGLRYAELSGRRHDALTNMATLKPGVDVAAVMPQSGGVGVDMSSAKVGVWYSLAQYLAHYDQGVTRLHRPPSTGTRFYSLIVGNSIDQDIHTAIADRREIVAGVWDRMKLRKASRAYGGSSPAHAVT